jgi:DNA-binding transcriptional MocR family regulator
MDSIDSKAVPIPYPHAFDDYLGSSNKGIEHNFAGATLGTRHIPADEWSDVLQEVAADYATAWQRYADFRGERRLRKAISDHLSDTGWSLRPEQIEITTGCLHAIETMLRRLLAKGDSVAILAPTYFGFLQAVRNVGAGVRTIPVDMSGGLDWDAAHRTLSASDCRTLLCTPFAQNPTGYSFGEAERKKLLDLCAANDVVIIEDGIYDDLYFSGSRRAPVALMGSGAAYYCSSFSKTLSPALRVGFIVHPKQASIYANEGYRNLGLAGGADQFALAHFISTGRYQRQLERIRPLLAAQMEDTVRILRDELPAGCRVSHPQGGRVLWVELTPDRNSHLVARRAQEHGIGVLPGPVCSPEQAHQRFLRIDTGSPLDDSRRAALYQLCNVIREKATGID